MGTNCAPLLADIFLYSYQAEFIPSLLSTGRKRLASQFNFTYRYIDDVLLINNPDFENYLGPPELDIKDTTESNTSASYLDLLLSIGRDGELHTSLYDKRDDFNFHITNFPFLSSNIQFSPAYGVFISQLIRYARDCSFYECFILRAVRLSNKLLGQGYVNVCKETFEIVSMEVLWSVRGSYQTIWGPSLPNVTRHSGWWPATMTTSIDRTLHKFLTLLLIWTLLPNLTFYRNARGFHRTFATGAACQQRTLTPPDTWSCPTFGLASVLMLRPISPELVLFRTFELRTSLGTSFLLLSYYWLNMVLVRRNVIGMGLVEQREVIIKIWQLLLTVRFEPTTFRCGVLCASNYTTDLNDGKRSMH